MSNGCICCTLREDLLLEIRRLAEEGRFDYLLIESTGISEPLPVAETFAFRDEDGGSLSDLARLDTLVTVVDAFNFLDDFGSLERLADRDQGLQGDERTLADLLVEQIEFCDVLILNKTDLLAEPALKRIEAMLAGLNPRALILRSTFGRVPPGEVLNTHRFDFDAAAEAPGWLAELRGEHPPESETYGISSFVYRARRPFHPQRFHDWAGSIWPGVIRSKGYFWLATRHALVGSWSQAGGLSRHALAGFWWAAVDGEHWPDDNGSLEQIRERWQSPYGDRQQELVLIGIDMSPEELTRRFDDCLLTDEEMALGPEVWASWPDPFEPWHIREDDPEFAGEPA